MTNQIQVATFAGGCFWCMVEPFDQQEGIIQIISGYTGGEIEDPTYEQVCSNTTGHVEAVQINYDSTKISYEQLVDLFWQQIDPTDAGGQFNDRGESYKTAIFYHDEDQRQVAESSKKQVEASKVFSKPIVTKVIPAKPFYPAEVEHQDYFKKQPAHYRAYKQGSGRESFINTHWNQNGDKEVLKNKLTPMQYHVTQEDGTEPPFQNEYWDNEEEGIYVDIISGEILFTSKDKFDAACGWPSFTKPVDPEQLIEKVDVTHGMVRTEIRSNVANSHLGHVFNDGPKEQGGLRYCMNSAAMRFIPKDKMIEAGYEKYLHLLN